MGLPPDTEEERTDFFGTLKFALHPWIPAPANQTMISTLSQRLK